MSEQSLKQQGKLPDALADAPDLWPWLTPYYTAFEELTTDRRDVGLGEIGPISWLAIDAYAKRHDPGVGSDFNTLLFYVRSIDQRYRKLLRDSRPKEPPAKNRASPKKPPPRPPRRRR